MDSEMAASSSSSSSSSSASSSAASEASCCPICLDPLKHHAYLDRCFHAFCYECITKWVQFAAAKHPRAPLSSIRCPLCKVENLSIIHGFNGGSFRRHYVNQDQRKRRLSVAHEFRSHMYSREEEIANNVFDVQRYWKGRKYLRQNMWLQNWLRREIQTITQEEDADVIVHHIQGVVESFMTRQQKESLKGTPEQKREEFRRLIFDAARPFLLGRTKRFVDELELFLASGLNIDAYDRVYMQRLSTSSLRDAREIDEEPSDQSVRSRFLYFLNEDDADTAD